MQNEQVSEMFLNPPWTDMVGGCDRAQATVRKRPAVTEVANADQTGLGTGILSSVPTVATAGVRPSALQGAGGEQAPGPRA